MTTDEHARHWLYWWLCGTCGQWWPCQAEQYRRDQRSRANPPYDDDFYGSHELEKRRGLR